MEEEEEEGEEEAARGPDEEDEVGGAEEGEEAEEEEDACWPNKDKGAARGAARCTFPDHENRGQKQGWGG